MSDTEDNRRQLEVEIFSGINKIITIKGMRYIPNYGWLMTLPGNKQAMIGVSAIKSCIVGYYDSGIIIYMFKHYCIPGLNRIGGDEVMILDSTLRYKIVKKSQIV